MKMQLHTARAGASLPDTFTEFDLAPVMGINKPKRAFWTSTYTPDEDYASAWLEWCAIESFGEWGKNYLIQPNADARILTIDCYETLARLPRATGGLFDLYECLDFATIAESYDAIHLISEALDVTRFPSIRLNIEYDGVDLYAWDCESTCWLRHAFTVIGELQS